MLSLFSVIVQGVVVLMISLEWSNHCVLCGARLLMILIKSKRSMPVNIESPSVPSYHIVGNFQ